MRRLIALLCVTGLGVLEAQTKVERPTERAAETREIVYFLQQPDRKSVV